ncbi:MAG TPA: sensor histidine kinase [Candidatus Dormibacteraeota bacterium]|nr:sensor histidine kinase [Candidatus Dormibacteraeota bacterium]
MTASNVPPATGVEADTRVGASPLGGARFLGEQLIADLESARAAAEQEIADCEERRAVLREQVDEADALRAHVVAHMQRLEPLDVDECYRRSGRLTTELTVVEERLRHLGAHVAAVGRSLDAARAVRRCLDDLATAAGASEVDSAARYRSASRQVFQIIEEERVRIARDIHDGPAQSMANVALAADVMERLVDRDPVTLRRELAQLKEGARGAVEDIRRLIFDLRPMTLDDLGLVPTLRKLVREFGDDHGVGARFHLAGEERRLSESQEAVVFRIVQEALTNVRKHARAFHVEVVLSLPPGRVSALVRDDGDGFDVAATQALQGRTRTLGLISMRERAALEQGHLEVRSEVGRGTEVRVTFDV